MNFFINRRVVHGPWGGGNKFVRCLYENLPKFDAKIVESPTPDNVDIIFLQSPFPDRACPFSINEAIAFKNKNPKIKIILRVNDCDARKNTDNVDRIWIETSRFVDKTIFVSEWMRDYFLEKDWFCKENFVVYNGVDKTFFKNRAKINNGKTNIVTHHWSNNPMKGTPTYQFLDDFVSKNEDFTFTYIGRVDKPLNNTKIIPPLFGKSLGEELSRYDVYISGTKFDPGPNHILESLACEIPTYVLKESGGAREFVGENNIFQDFDHLNDILLKKDFQKNQKITIDSWEECARKVWEKINEINIS